MAHMNVIRGQNFVMLPVSLNCYYDKCHRFELRIKFDDYFVLMSTMVVIVTVLVMTVLTADCIVFCLSGGSWQDGLDWKQVVVGL